MPWIVKDFDYFDSFVIIWGSFDIIYSDQLIVAEIQVSGVKDNEVSISEYFDLDGHVTNESEIGEVRMQRDVVVTRNYTGWKADIFPREPLSICGRGRGRLLDVRRMRRVWGVTCYVLRRTSECRYQSDSNDDDAQ